MSSSRSAETSPTSVASGGGGASGDPKELILSHLRKNKIKLWLPPYNQHDDNDENAALKSLAKNMSMELRDFPTDDNANNIDGSSTERRIHAILLELQSHAVERLIEKNSIDVKILGLANQNTLPQDICTTVAPFSAWGDNVCIVHGQGGKTLFRITNVASNLTVEAFAGDMKNALGAASLRLIWRGKNLLGSSSSSGGGQDVLLQKILSSSKKKSDKKKNELLCIISSVAAAASTSLSSSSSSTSAPTAGPEGERTDQSLIESIRTAARTMQSSSSGSRFEITDQSGNYVPMSSHDSASFLTALGLHRLGRTKMEEGAALLSGADNGSSIRQDAAASALASPSGVDSSSSSSSSNNNRQDAAASALVFLLEADAEWQNTPALESWKHKVDNYGLLQLDIAWIYLRLESLDALPDAIRRLDEAEAALQKQVHSNFVTLALVQAEMNNPIPPLCAVFVRLFLLQGVARMMVGGGENDAMGRERLQWARILCQRLRSACPAVSVDHLSNAFLVDRFTAISALRRSNGDPEAAGCLISADRSDENRAERKRYRQQRIGKCSNGTDYVNLDVAPILCGMLNFPIPSSFDLSNDEGYEDDDANELCMGALVVIGLLRLSDNDVEKSLELYQQFGADEVLKRVQSLDESIGARKRLREGKKQQQVKHEVRDIDLAMLMSMGVDESRGRDALKATGNVDEALLWLSKENDDKNGGALDEGETIATDSSNGGPNEDQYAESDAVGVAASAADAGRESSFVAAGPTRSNDRSGGTRPSREEIEARAAQELLMRELGMAIRDDSKELEKEWLGMDMDEEWSLIEKYGGK